MTFRLLVVALSLGMSGCATRPTPFALSLLPGLGGPRGVIVPTSGSLESLRQVRTVYVTPREFRGHDPAIEALSRGVASALPEASIVAAPDADLVIVYRASYNVLCLDDCRPQDYLPEYAVVEVSSAKFGLLAKWWDSTNWTSEVRLPTLFARALRIAGR